VTLLLGDVITATRDKSADFHPTRLPDGVLARYFSSYQRELLSLAQERYPELVTSQISIVFPPVGTPASLTLDQVGAGTVGGLPAIVDPDGTVDAIAQLVGNTVQMPVEGAPVQFGPTVVTAATQTTLTVGGSPGWSTNQWVGNAVAIVAGTDTGDLHMIQSNTANQLTIESSGWDSVPNTTSVMTIVSLTPSVDDTSGSVLGFPMTGTRTSYLVRLDVNGNAFIDVTQPLTGQYDLGIMLPPYKSILGQPTIYFQDSTFGNPNTMPLTIVDYKQRMRAWGQYTAYFMSNSIYFIGYQSDWQTVQSVDIRYVPIPPVFQALTDAFILPDDSYQALVARGAQFAAERLVGSPDSAQLDLGYYSAMADRSESIWLDQIGNMNKVKTMYTESAW
jgi:hypothetical protein